jgi:hypothetical protein
MVLEAATIPTVDLTAADMLGSLAGELPARASDCSWSATSARFAMCFGPLKRNRHWPMFADHRCRDPRRRCRRGSDDDDPG